LVRGFVLVATLSWSAPGEAAEPRSPPPKVFESEHTATPRLEPPAEKAPVDQLIPWLLSEDRQLREIPFSEVIVRVTGKKMLACDPKNQIDERVVKSISAAYDETVKRLNVPDSAIKNIARINEVSGHFEDMLRELLNATPGLNCDFPRTAQGRVMRSGYPDLRIVDLASKRVFYLDPKLYAAGSRESSFRAFYFEPKIATNKVHDDAVHFIAGLSTNRAKRAIVGTLRAGTLSILPSLK
jgi:hypothetical protein